MWSSYRLLTTTCLFNETKALAELLGLSFKWLTPSTYPRAQSLAGSATVFWSGKSVTKSIASNRDLPDPACGYKIIRLLLSILQLLLLARFAF